MILVGTEQRVSELDGGQLLTGHRVVWLDARSVLTDGGDVVEIVPGGGTVTHVDDATYFARTQPGLFIGTARAHLVRDGGAVESFDGVPTGTRGGADRRTRAPSLRPRTGPCT